MQERKLRLGLAFFNYGSNGGIAAEHPDIRQWTIPTVIAAKSDPRIEEIVHEDFCDTPVTMSRNAAVHWAQQAKVDVLVMIDSDQSPDKYLGHDPNAKPFFESSFDFLYKNFDKHISVIVSPYCGPPPDPVHGGLEMPYVFRWTSFETLAVEWPVKLEAYSRHEAALMTGISNVDTGPTGLCMIDMRVFEHLSHPYFDYEWDGENQQCPHCKQMLAGERRKKASTEDCFFFRNIALNCTIRLGYNPVFCNWDAWAGHWKPKNVGKPKVVTSDMVGKQLHDAVLGGVKANTRLIQVGKVVTPADGVVSAVPAISEQPKVMTHPEVQQMVAGIQANTPKCGDEWIYGTDDPDPEDLGHKTPADNLRALSTLVENYCWDRSTRHADGSVTFDHNLVIVELGAWVGRSARAIVAGVPPHVTDYEVHSVDLFQMPEVEKKSDWATLSMWEAAEKRRVEKNDPDPILNQYKENLERANILNKRVFFHRNNTVDAARAWPMEKPVDILFVDAGHSVESVQQDLMLWGVHVRHGGIIVGDDWNNRDVQIAVTEYFGLAEHKVKVINNMWYVDFKNGD